MAAILKRLTEVVRELNESTNQKHAYGKLWEASVIK